MVMYVFKLDDTPETNAAALILAQRIAVNRDDDPTELVKDFSEENCFQSIQQDDRSSLFFLGRAHTTQIGNYNVEQFVETFHRQFERCYGEVAFSTVHDLYMLGCELGTKSKGPLAQALADALFARGFLNFSLHTITWPPSASHLQVKVITTPGEHGQRVGDVQAFLSHDAQRADTLVMWTDDIIAELDRPCNIVVPNEAFAGASKCLEQEQALVQIMQLERLHYVNSRSNSSTKSIRKRLLDPHEILKWLKTALRQEKDNWRQHLDKALTLCGKEKKYHPLAVLVNRLRGENVDDEIKAAGNTVTDRSAMHTVQASAACSSPPRGAPDSPERSPQSPRRPGTPRAMLFKAAAHVLPGTPRSPKRVSEDSVHESASVQPPPPLLAEAGVPAFRSAPALSVEQLSLDVASTDQAQIVGLPALPAKIKPPPEMVSSLRQIKKYARQLKENYKRQCWWLGWLGLFCMPSLMSHTKDYKADKLFALVERIEKEFDPAHPERWHNPIARVMDPREAEYDERLISGTLTTNTKNLLTNIILMQPDRYIQKPVALLRP